MIIDNFLNINEELDLAWGREKVHGNGKKLW